MLTGQVAIVTGASRGIGRATALELARSGVTTILAARRAEACEPIVTAIQDGGGQAEAAACDVSRYADV